MLQYSAVPSGENCHEAVPVLFIHVPDDPEPGPFDGGLDLRLPPFDDAGGDKNPVPAKESGNMDGEGNDHVGNDVGQHDVIVRAERTPQRSIRNHVSRHNTNAVGAEAVQRRICRRDVRGFGVNVTAEAAVAAKDQRADPEDTAATAQIQNALPGRGVFLQRLEAHPRRGVAAGSER